MSIGKKLKSLRVLNNNSMKDIANLLNMSLSNYGKIERDEIEISRNNTEKLAKHYNLKIDDLINSDNLVVNVTNQDGGKSWAGVNNNFHENMSENTLRLISQYEARVLFLENELKEKNKQIEKLITKK